MKNNYIGYGLALIILISLWSPLGFTEGNQNIKIQEYGVVIGEQYNFEFKDFYFSYQGNNTNYESTTLSFANGSLTVISLVVMEITNVEETKVDYNLSCNNLIESRTKREVDFQTELLALFLVPLNFNNSPDFSKIEWTISGLDYLIAPGENHSSIFQFNGISIDALEPQIELEYSIYEDYSYYSSSYWEHHLGAYYFEWLLVANYTKAEESTDFQVEYRLKMIYDQYSGLLLGMKTRGEFQGEYLGLPMNINFHSELIQEGFQNIGDFILPTIASSPSISGLIENNSWVDPLPMLFIITLINYYFIKKGRKK
ncbi:MAG: hypothetical protein GF308_22225 [Candidatus Heimdallarchaeota archaeon]|nr:hypothetical protein [Candidatus Heimdallarchaeota archaeon]